MGDHQFGSFTQGIIDLLINTTGEFVTERPESSQMVNNMQIHVEGVDHYAGYGEFNQKKRDECVNEEIGEQFDFDNYIEKISEGASVGMFKCNICGHTSALKSTVRLHVESKHFPGVAEYPCDQCEKKFNTKTKFRRHRYYHHSNKKK